MDSAKLNDWLQVMGIFALVASLVFVGLQMKQAQEIGQGEASVLVLDSLSSFRSLVIENAEVWRRGCMGEELSDGDQTRFALMYNHYLSVAYFTWLTSQVGILRFDVDVTVNAYAANLHRYPGLANMAASKHKWGAEGSKFDDQMVARFREALQARMAELKEIEPEPLSDPNWCGSFS